MVWQVCLCVLNSLPKRACTDGRSTLSQILCVFCSFGIFRAHTWLSSLPAAGNIFALRDGRIAYVDFGNVAELSQSNKQTLIDAVVHAVNEDYFNMATDFIKLVRLHRAATYMLALTTHDQEVALSLLA